MTDIQQSPIQQIPSKQGNEQIGEAHNPIADRDSAADRKNIQSEPLKKRKKKHHAKKQRKHSPEYYEQKKVQKIYKQRENNWDSHFMNDAIPSMLASKKSVNSRRLFSRQYNDRGRSISGMQKHIPQRTVGVTNFKSTKLPILQKNPKSKISFIQQAAKSFKIRVVNQKNQEATEILQKRNTTGVMTNKEFISQKSQKSKSKVKIKLKRHNQSEDAETSQLRLQYTKKLEQVFQQTKFFNCHKEVLQLFFSFLHNKGIKNMIDKQLSNLVSRKSLINNCMNVIQQRQKQIEKLKNCLKQKSGSIVPYQIVESYRTSTIACIQEILKWKEIWQNAYQQVFQKPTTFNLINKAQNYLVSIISSVDFVLESGPQKQKTVDQRSQQNNDKSVSITKDPFLISLFDISKQNKDVILKIRACELLLLEEQYNNCSAQDDAM